MSTNFLQGLKPLKFISLLHKFWPHSKSHFHTLFEDFDLQQCRSFLLFLLNCDMSEERDFISPEWAERWCPRRLGRWHLSIIRRILQWA